MSKAGETLVADRIAAAGYRAREPFPGRVNQRLLMECIECGELHRLRPDTKLKPCQHKMREHQRQQAEAAERRRYDALVAVRTRTLSTKNLRALEPHPGTEGVFWWVQCKYCDRSWHMREDKLRACPHKGTGDEGAPPPPVKPAPKKRTRKPKDGTPSFEHFWEPLPVRWTVRDLPEGSNRYQTTIMRGWWDAATTREREQRLTDQRNQIVATVARTTDVDVDPAGVTYTIGDADGAGPAHPAEEPR
ncbi:hypothetical protein [Streptomyces sp. NPDC059631]|uniref:hypothetical protein n=1 Tax=unclassified Streptomyces TaxID=2593676 RepID=UPI0036862C25